jgi:hypothetical protein
MTLGAAAAAAVAAVTVGHWALVLSCHHPSYPPLTQLQLMDSRAGDLHLQQQQPVLRQAVMQHSQ